MAGLKGRRACSLFISHDEGALECSLKDFEWHHGEGKGSGSALYLNLGQEMFFFLSEITFPSIL